MPRDGLGSYVWYNPQDEGAWQDGGHKLDVREGSRDPFSPQPIRVVHTRVVPPQWEAPDYWAEPWEDMGETCVKFSETPTYCYSVRVPEMSMVTVNAVSYQWNAPLALDDIFVVEILRNHDTLARWEDRVVRIAGDLGNRFALASHSVPAPCFARFDRNDVIGCRVTYRGPYPFALAPNVPVPGQPQFRVVFNGWRSTITGNVDGQAKNQRVMGVEEAKPYFDKVMELVKLRGGRF